MFFLLQTQSSHLSEVCSLQQRLEELDSELRQCQESCRLLQEQLHHKDILLQENSSKMTELSHQVSIENRYFTLMIWAQLFKNGTLKFQTIISEKCQGFLLKKCEKLSVQKLLTFLPQKYLFFVIKS